MHLPHASDERADGLLCRRRPGIRLESRWCTLVRACCCSISSAAALDLRTRSTRQRSVYPPCGPPSRQQFAGVIIRGGRRTVNRLPRKPLSRPKKRKAPCPSRTRGLPGMVRWRRGPPQGDDAAPRDTGDVLPLGGRHLRQSVTSVYHWTTSFPGVDHFGGSHTARSRPAAQGLAGPPHRRRRRGTESRILPRMPLPLNLHRRDSIV